MQRDGWGVAYYANNRPIVRKSEKPVYDEPDKFRSVSREARSNMIVAHIRKASNPRRLPLNQLIGIENTQPFSMGNYVFAHNGTINLPGELEDELGEYRAQISGVNDSEVYFWYLMKEIHSGKDPIRAFYSSVDMMDNLWLKFRHSHRDKSYAYVGLNTITTDGRKLYAFCRFHDEYGNSEVSLCQPDQKYFQMSYLAGKNNLVVASEKLTRDSRWRLIDTDQVLIAEVVDHQLHHELVRVPSVAVR